MPDGERRASLAMSMSWSPKKVIGSKSARSVAAKYYRQTYPDHRLANVKRAAERRSFRACQGWARYHVTIRHVGPEFVKCVEQWSTR